MTEQGMKTKSSKVAGQKEEKTIAVSGGKLAYDVQGEGPVVLCLPGMGDTRREFEHFAPALIGAGYRVITTDLRGNGGSTGKFKAFNLSDLCNDITAILDAEKVSEAILAACSISGASAGLYAIEHPERVKSLVLFNPIMHTGNLLLSYLMAGALSFPVLGKKVWLTYFKSLYPTRPVEADYMAELKASADKPGAGKSLAGMALARRIDNDIQKIKVPALIYFGGKDPDFKNVQAEAAELTSKISGARVKVLEGLGHYPQRERPEAVLPETLEWLAEHK